MNKKAIVVYLDNSSKMEIEFSWLYKTWKLYSLEDEFDLVVYYNPDAKNIVIKFDGIKSYEMPYIRMANEYKFLNSHYFCLEPWCEPLKKYEYLLKTDCDVFLTENIKGFTPGKFMVGEGCYYYGNVEKKIEYTKKISKDLGLHYNHMSYIGASFFGKTNHVLFVTKNQAIITEKILDNYSKTEEFTDVGFHRGISSMIAAEIIINHAFSNQHVTLYGLDSKCWKTTKIGSDVLHIHAWHTDQVWSKHAFFKSEYDNWIIEDQNAFENSSNYCQWIAKMDYEKLSELKEKYKNKEINIDYKMFEDDVTECVFINDGGIKVKLPKHKYSDTFKSRDNHEVMFRRISSWLIDNEVVKNNIIDLGAWIGDNSIVWAKKIDKIVFAIDPSPSNGDFIKNLIDLNQLTNVKFIQKAISDKNKTISTRLEFGENLHHCSFDENEEGKTKLESFSLDYLFENGEIYDIGYIHLDVEGMEFTVIKGCLNIIEKYSPVIAFEQHLTSDDYIGLTEFLSNIGYKVYMINESLPGCNYDCRNFLALKNLDAIPFEICLHFKQKDLLIHVQTNNLINFL
jgi:FkbM family methyltransferase